MVCILGVPTHISLSDLLAFLSPVRYVQVISTVGDLMANFVRLYYCFLSTYCSMSHFLSAFISSSLLALQVVRDSTPNRYMMLLKFKEKVDFAHVPLL